MPSSSDGLVLVLRHHHAGQRAGQIALEVGEDHGVVVGGRQQIVRVRREPHTPHITGVHLKLLNRSNIKE